MNPYDHLSAFEKRLLKNMDVEIEKLNKMVREDFFKCRVPTNIKPRVSNRMPVDEYTIREYNAKSKIGDKDMLLLHIDIALDNGDREQFDRLTKQLQEAGIDG